MVSDGTGKASDYAVSLTSGTLTVSAAGFDYGISGSAVRSGYVGVLPTTTYTASQGYGWLAAVQGRDRGTLSGTTMSDLLESMNFGTSPGTFEVDGLTPGASYDVTVTLGDTYAANATVTVPSGFGSVVGGDGNLSNVSTAAGQYTDRTVTVTPNAAGKLQLAFSTTGAMWAADALCVRPTVTGGTLSGPSGSLTADGTSVNTFSESGLTPGDVYTVSTTLGSVTTADADSRYAGTQVIVSSSGTLSFQVQRPSSAGTATVTAQEVEGKAWATMAVTYQSSAPGTAGPASASSSAAVAATPFVPQGVPPTANSSAAVATTPFVSQGVPPSASSSAAAADAVMSLAVPVASDPPNADASTGVSNSTMARSQIGSGSSASPALGSQFTNDRVVNAALQALLLDESTVTSNPRPLFDP